MIKIREKIKAFTITEAILVLVIMGFILMLVMPYLRTINPSRKGWDNLAIKTAEHIHQSTMQMLIFNSGFGTLKSLKFNNDIFSIEDPDADQKMSDIYKYYLSYMDYNIDTSNEYFKKEIKDYKRNTTGIVLSDKYSHFMYIVDGVLIGFRFYGTCNATELNANPPKRIEKYSINNICGSVFIDVNSFKKPNLLGLDQYIIPISETGIIYN